MSFEGKVAVITGGSRGIGRAIADLLASQGAHVVIAARQFETAEKAAQEIAAAHGVKVLAVSLDVSNFASAQQLIDQTITNMGQVDILVNNAGITRDKLMMQMKEEDWDLVLDTNLKGAFNCSKAAIRSMIKQRYGRIVNVTSVSGLAGQAGQTNYSSAKAGMIGLTKALAREVATRNITVNAVAPGYIPTDLTSDLTADLKEKILGAIPMNRFGTVEEIAHAVAFLASSEAAYITGQVLSVDGGLVMM